MNNRILAALFALAIALFIGVAPVKAEATHVHYDDTGNYNCDVGGCDEHVHHLTKVEKVDADCTQAGSIEYYVCPDCAMCFRDEAATDYIASPDDLVIPMAEHELVWEVNDDTHVLYCTGCDYVDVTESKHNWSKKDNGDGTHTMTCKYCQKEVTAEHDDGTKKDCKCGVCSAEMEHTCGDWKVYPSDKTKHFHQCTVCKKTVETEAHNYAYTAEGGYTHIMTCTVCGHVQGGEWCVDTDPVDHKCDLCGDAMGHSYDAEYMVWVQEDATCTEDGIWGHKQCNVCGLRLNEKGTTLDETTMVKPATGHNLQWYHNDEGHWQVCTNEACTYQTGLVPHDASAYKHVDGEDRHIVDCATCGRGSAFYTEECVDQNGDCQCDLCGGSLKHEHDDLTYHKAVAATCTTDGNIAYYTCKTCKAIITYTGGVYAPYTGETVTKALGHDWEWEENVSGQHIVHCKVCEAKEIMGHTDTDGDCLCDFGTCNTLVHSHTLIHFDEVPASCGIAGTEEYYKYKDCGKMFDMNQNPITAPVEIPALDHVAGDEFEAIDGNQHAIKCKNCGEVMKTEPHVDSSNEDNRCDVCKVELTLEEVPEKPATCTDIGYEKCWKSPLTDRMYADPYGNEHITSQKVIPAKGHTYTISNGAQHKCEDCDHAMPHTASEEHPCFCSVCNLPIGGHTIEAVAAVEPTCTKAGTEAYVKCSCGAMYDAQGNVITKVKTIPATGHILDTTMVNDTAEGDHYMTCTVCGYEAHEGHAMAVKDPLKGNYHQYVCDCGKVVTEQHADKDGDNICDACDHDMSGSSVEVENHDSKTVVTGEAETVDNSKSWIQNWFSNLFGSNAGGSASSNSTKESATTNGSTQDSKSDASGNQASAADNSGNEVTNSGSSGQNSNTNTSTETGIINEFIQWLSQLFGAWLQGK